MTGTEAGIAADRVTGLVCHLYQRPYLSSRPGIVGGSLVVNILLPVSRKAPSHRHPIPHSILPCPDAAADGLDTPITAGFLTLTATRVPAFTAISVGIAVVAVIQLNTGVLWFIAFVGERAGKGKREEVLIEGLAI
ncbi:hypothetical protein N657DRAFT_642384 [Parathielavia appendiculata]|uniref:Uncharacterized protein n=1 Tax=Parathielavia appendiculata TaxID=2587402 RepID=A0AAN6U379_9PEZI|nr:hypothetical protein N657DRAFT_642384 [Parathielavia appendiculata]